MPWAEVSTMSSRAEFVRLTVREGANVRAPCRWFGIGPTTSYTWIARHHAKAAAGLADRSRARSVAHAPARPK